MRMTRALLVAAHPDDEVLGAGAQLPRMHGLRLIHVTDGGPRNLLDARAAGFTTRLGYVAARREELHGALQLAGIDPLRCETLEVVDQEASYSLASLTERLVEIFLNHQAEVVFSHAYEGGHPDHDATAFAVHAACRLIARRGARSPWIVEFTSYHARGGSLRTGDFLPGSEVPTLTLSLTEGQRALKARMLGRFTTQARTLQSFGISHERFRVAPLYRLTRLPHAGRLWYENFDWDMDGRRWRRLSGAALGELGIEEPL
jgi:LmbE family N-acetylglucosaminyl deacetylase